MRETIRAYELLETERGCRLEFIEGYGRFDGRGQVIEVVYLETYLWEDIGNGDLVRLREGLGSDGELLRAYGQPDVLRVMDGQARGHCDSVDRLEFDLP